MRGGTRIGVLSQADTLDDDLTIGEAVVGDTPEYEWAGDARTRDVIEGLLAELPWDARLGSLSGGQRRRVSLARLLAGTGTFSPSTSRRTTSTSRPSRGSPGT